MKCQKHQNTPYEPRSRVQEAASDVYSISKGIVIVGSAFSSVKTGNWHVAITGRGIPASELNILGYVPMSLELAVYGKYIVISQHIFMLDLLSVGVNQKKFDDNARLPRGQNLLMIMTRVWCAHGRPVCCVNSGSFAFANCINVFVLFSLF